ncbi:uncharacterized protein LOC135138425 [Zophobas morio]|uniref:uncharacterized protein LOC135138425 n=1 Tax=Zophobas morio TaxID=2755281 RepID=UPI003082E5B6
MSYLSWPLQPHSPYNEIILDSMHEGNLTQLVSEPTRIRQNQSPSQTDLIFANDPDLLTKIEYLPPFGKSDHLVISSNVQIYVNPTKKLVKKIKHTNYGNVRRDLANFNWISMFQTSNACEMWEVFQSKLSASVNNHTYVKEVKLIPNKPWIDNRLVQLIKHKRQLWTCYKNSSSEDRYREHRIFSNHVTTELKKARQLFENNLTETESPKKFYKYIRSMLSTKVGIPLLRKPDGSLCTSNQQTADLLADEFHHNYSKKTFGPFIQSSIHHKNFLSTISITEENIKATLEEIARRKSAPGPDNITCQLIAACLDEIIYPIYLIAKSSFEESILPPQWLTANVTPISKKGDKLLESFRSSSQGEVTIQATLCRVFQIWNNLPEQVINAQSTNIFKNRYDQHANLHL